MKKYVRIPYALVLMIGCLVTVFSGGLGIEYIQYTGIWGIARSVTRVLPLVLLVLMVANRFVHGRVVPETAAVVCYVLGTASLLVAFHGFMELYELLKSMDWETEMILGSGLLIEPVGTAFSGWIFFLVAAHIQDEEVTGRHTALGTLGCIAVFFVTCFAYTDRLCVTQIIPLLLELGYIKRLPVAFSSSGGATFVRGFLYTIIMVALFFAGPSILA